jgi:hypothetical protein
MTNMTDKILSKMKKDKIDWESFEEFWNESKEEINKLKEFTMSNSVKRNNKTSARTVTSDSFVQV